MVDRGIALYLVAVGVVVVLVWVGLSLDQSAVAAAGVIIALILGLTSLLPQLLASNRVRYTEHKEFFAGVLLPQAGSMQLIPGAGMVYLPENRIGWKLREDGYSIFPGFGETPLFRAMLRPHLSSGGAESIWADFAAAYSDAEAKVRTYTTARREYDAKLRSRVEKTVRERAGEGFRLVWFNERASDRRVTESKFSPPTCNAGNFRSTCELAYLGKFERDPGNRWEYHRPTPHPEDREQGLSWRIAVGGGDGRDYLWGGEQPADLEKVASSLDDFLVSLRDDSDLKRLYLAAEAAEDKAKESLEQLPALAEHAASILRHGQDIPGECPSCARWSPRL